MKLSFYFLVCIPIMTLQGMEKVESRKVEGQKDTLLNLLKPELTGMAVAYAAFNSCLNTCILKETAELTRGELRQLSADTSTNSSFSSQCMNVAEMLAHLNDEKFLKNDPFHDSLCGNLYKAFSSLRVHQAMLSLYAHYTVGHINKEFIFSLSEFFLGIEKKLEDLQAIPVSPEKLKLLPSIANKLSLKPHTMLYDVISLLPEEFEALIRENGLTYYTQLFKIAEFEKSLEPNVNSLQKTDFEPVQIKQYLEFFYKNYNSCKNILGLLAQGPDLEKAIKILDKYYIAEWHINAHLPTRKALENVRSFLQQHTAPTVLTLLLTLAIERGNKDLAALTIQEGALHAVAQSNAQSALRPRLNEDLIKQSTNRTREEDFIKQLTNRARELGNSDMAKFLENCCVQSPYFKLPAHNGYHAFAYRQFNVGQQQEKSSRASGYHAVRNGLLLSKDLGKKDTNELEAVLMLSADDQLLTKLREKVLEKRIIELATESIHDRLLSTLKAATKVQKYRIRKERRVLIERLLLEDASVVVGPSRCIAQYNEIMEDIPLIAYSLALKADKNDSTKRNYSMQWSEIASYFKESIQRDIDRYFDTTRPLEFVIESSKNKLIISIPGDSNESTIAYERTFGPHLHSSSTTALHDSFSLTYAQRKEILQTCCKDKGLFIDDSGKTGSVSCLFFESLIRATNEWDKESLQKLIPTAYEASLMCLPEKVMHADELPLRYSNEIPVDWTNSMAVTPLDKHIYAQWKNVEKEVRHAKKMRQEADSEATAGDWLLPLEVCDLMTLLLSRENGGQATVGCLTKEGDLMVYSSDKKCIKTTMRELFLQIAFGGTTILFIECDHQWAVSVLKKIGDRVQMVVADSTNCERRFEPVLTKFLDTQWEIANLTAALKEHLDPHGFEKK